MREQASVALIVPTRDRAALLRRLLVSLDASRLPASTELVVVDDGSTDDTASVAARSRLPLRYIRTAGSGPAVARNAGWRATTAPVVVFLDDDCVVEADAVTELVRALDGADVAGAAIEPMSRRGIGQRLMHLEELSRNRVDDDGVVRWLVMVATAVRRDALAAVGGFDEAFGRAGEDVDLCYRLRAAGYRLALAPRAVVLHEDRGGLRALWRTYYRHGTAQRRLLARHRVRGGDVARSARQRASVGHWVGVYRRYRGEEGVAVSVACLALRAVMMIPWLAGAALGDRYTAPAGTAGGGTHGRHNR